MANKKKSKSPGEEASVKENSLAVEVGRIAKLFALFILKDVGDESKKVMRLKATGFSAQEIAALLDKTVINVRTQVSQAKRRLEE